MRALRLIIVTAAGALSCLLSGGPVVRMLESQANTRVVGIEPSLPIPPPQVISLSGCTSSSEYDPQALDLDRYPLPKPDDTPAILSRARHSMRKVWKPP